MNKVVTPSSPLWLIGTAVGFVWQTSAVGQEQPAQVQQAGDQQTIEEVVAIGRFLSASEQVAAERLNDSAVIDTLAADSISRLGDSTVAAALRRVPGLSLVGDKFVYVRGLGERYSATTLNGAQIPSPDLTRNVIPLDVFPTSVVESLRVQKTWSPDVWANFGGGSVDVRTQGIPPEFIWNFEIGTGYSSATPSSVHTYPGGGDDNMGTDDGTRALASDINTALYRYRGDLSVENIQLRDPSLTLAEAQAINRSLSLDLYRNIAVRGKSAPVDTDLKASIGNSFDLSDNWSLGVLAGATYQNHWRGTTAYSHNFRPDLYNEYINTREDSVQSVDLSGNLNVGLQFTEDHSVSLTSLYLRNTDDRTTIEDFHNENGVVSEGRGFRDYTLRFEERNLRTNQLEGSHYLGTATREMFPWLSGLLRFVPEETLIEWVSSESKASTDIPNEVTINSQTTTDPTTAAVLSEHVQGQSDAGSFRFTRLDDTVNSYSWSITWPIETDRSRIELKAGTAHSEKARTYRQTDLSLGPLAGTPVDVLSGPLNDVFSDSNVTDYSFDFRSNQNNTRSYLAATMTDAVFGMVDWTINDTWRVVVGSRWENYRQAALAWQPYGYPQITSDADELEEATFQTDKSYPAVSFTYMGSWWAETFQLRVGASKTAVRPDLREIMDASYLDPVTGDLTYGNPGVVPAEVSNLDIRGEWFFSNGDSFTVTAFNKDITNPIEFFERQGSDTTIVRGIRNADSATINGVEFEGLKRLGFMGPRFEPFFVQGNLTLQDSELTAGSGVNAAVQRTRGLVGASDYVANLMLGYDSRNARHTVSLIFNVFGERLYVPGDLPGHPDALEQPFNSLDLTYSWYATDMLTVKAKAQNLLGEKIEIERNGVTTYELDPGSNFAVSVQWGF